MFFNSQPDFYYPYKGGLKLSKNLFRRVRFRDNLNALYVASSRYTIQQGETPEQISNKQYGSPDWYWTILILNNIIDVNNDWPVSDYELDLAIEKKYGNTQDDIKFWETKELYAGTNLVLSGGVIVEYNEGRAEQQAVGYYPRTIKSSGSFITGKPYRIESIGTNMDFTAIGASANTVGTTFIATSPGPITGTGLASSEYSFSYTAGNQTVNLFGVEVLNGVTNREFEYRENENKKEIFLIRPEFLTTMQEEISTLFAYDTEYKIDSAGVRFSETII